LPGALPGVTPLNSASEPIRLPTPHFRVERSGQVSSMFLHRAYSRDSVPHLAVLRQSFV